jgi:acyl-CoA dehydrogenase
MAFYHLMTFFSRGRTAVAAQGVGIAQGAFDEALKYSQERVQFGKPICEFQAIQFKLAEMATEIEAARLLTYRAAWEISKGGNPAKIASMAKLYASRVAREVANEALQIHGGYGFIKEYHVERFYRDAKITELYEGTSEIQKLIIARALLGKIPG